MRLALLVSAAATLGCLLPTSLAAQERSEPTDLRTEIRKIVREEIRAALREMRAQDSRQAQPVRPGATPQPLAGAVRRTQVRDAAKERAAERLEVEVEGMDRLIEQIDQEVKKHEQSLRQFAAKHGGSEAEPKSIQRTGAVLHAVPGGGQDVRVERVVRSVKTATPGERAIRVVQRKEAGEKPEQAGHGLQFELGDLQFDGQVHVQVGDGKPMTFVMEDGKVLQLGGGEGKPARKAKAGKNAEVEGAFEIELQGVGENAKAGCKCNCPCCGNKAKAAAKPGARMMILGEQDGEGEVMFFDGKELRSANKANAGKRAKVDDDDDEDADEAKPAKKAKAKARAKDDDDDDDDAEEARPAKKVDSKVQFFGVPAGKPATAAKAKSKGDDDDDADDDDEQPSKMMPPAKAVPATPAKPGTLRIRQLLV